VLRLPPLLIVGEQAARLDPRSDGNQYFSWEEGGRGYRDRIETYEEGRSGKSESDRKHCCHFFRTKALDFESLVLMLVLPFLKLFLTKELKRARAMGFCAGLD